MILVAGLSPAYQRILTFPHLRTAEVNRATSVTECPSGKSINVAVALQSLNQHARLLTVLGGARGERLRARMDSELKLNFEAVESIGETRFCQTLRSLDQGTTTELVEESPPLMIEEQQDFERRFQRLALSATFVVLTGSVPPTTSPTLYRTLLESAGKPALVDAQRELLWQTLPARPLVVKPNRDELTHTVGRELHSEADVIGAARELQQAGAQWVVVTHGPHPVLAIGPQEVFRVVPPQPTEIVNPIGCGDSLAAGLVSALVSQETFDMPAALQQGVACAVANLSAARPAWLSPSVVESYRSRVLVESMS